MMTCFSKYFQRVEDKYGWEHWIATGMGLRWLEDRANSPADCMGAFRQAMAIKWWGRSFLLERSGCSAIDCRHVETLRILRNAFGSLAKAEC